MWTPEFRTKAEFALFGSVILGVAVWWSSDTWIGWVGFWLMLVSFITLLVYDFRYRSRPEREALYENDG